MSAYLNLHLGYALAIALGAALIVVFRPVSHLAASDRTQYYRLQSITLVAAVLGVLLYFAITRYGYHWVNSWPFLTR